MRPQKRGADLAQIQCFPALQVNPYLCAPPTFDLNRAFGKTGGRGRNDLDKTHGGWRAPHNPGFRRIQAILESAVVNVKFAGSSEYTAFSGEVRGKRPKILRNPRSAGTRLSPGFEFTARCVESAGNMFFDGCSFGFHRLSFLAPLAPTAEPYQKASNRFMQSCRRHT
jgi:hypothetical protein